MQNTTVVGGIEVNVAPEALPNINISTFDNSTTQSVTTLAPGNYNQPMVITGPTYCSGDITFQQPVTFVNASLFVNGQFNCQSSLLGSGSLFVTRNCQVKAAINLDPSTNIAVFSNGNIDLNDNGIFQGMLYTHGSIQVHGQLQVVGAVIAQGQNASIQLNDLSQQYRGDLMVTYVPQFVAFASSFISNKNLTTSNLTQLFWRQNP
jgi:hypothetical protein